MEARSFYPVGLIMFGKIAYISVCVGEGCNTSPTGVGMFYKNVLIQLSFLLSNIYLPPNM